MQDIIVSLKSNLKRMKSDENNIGTSKDTFELRQSMYIKIKLGLTCSKTQRVL